MDFVNKSRMSLSSPTPKQRATLPEKWRGLRPGDRVRLLALLALLQIMDRSLKAYGLRRTKAWLRLDRPLARPTAPSASSMRDAQRLAELACMAGQHGPGNTSCLRKALAVQWWLRRRGLESELRLGVRKVGTRLDAHAWVELDGMPLAQPNPTCGTRLSRRLPIARAMDRTGRSSLEPAELLARSTIAGSIHRSVSMLAALPQLPLRGRKRSPSTLRAHRAARRPPDSRSRWVDGHDADPQPAPTEAPRRQSSASHCSAVSRYVKRTDARNCVTQGGDRKYIRATVHTLETRGGCT